MAAKNLGWGDAIGLAERLPPDARALRPTVLPPRSAQHDNQGIMPTTYGSRPELRRRASMDFEQVRYEKSEGIATITLTRPERMNAFTPRMLDEWLAALQDAHLDGETRVIVLTGEGRGF